MNNGNGIYDYDSHLECCHLCRWPPAAVTLGTNLKDHNGPGISSGAWAMAGGVLIIAVATYFGTLTVG